MKKESCNALEKTEFQFVNDKDLNEFMAIEEEIAGIILALI